MNWTFIGVFAYAVINQVDEVEELENFTRLMKEVLFAIIFLSLLLFRFIYMRFARAAMPQLDMPKSLILLARTVHLGMYASLALIAITGLIIGGLYYFGVKDGLVLEGIRLSHEIFFLDKRKPDGFTYCWSDLSPFTGRWCLECHGSHTEGRALEVSF